MPQPPGLATVSPQEVGKGSGFWVCVPTFVPEPLWRAGRLSHPGTVRRWQHQLRVPPARALQATRRRAASRARCRAGLEPRGHTPPGGGRFPAGESSPAA